MNGGSKLISSFLATLVALHFTLVSHSASRWVVVFKKHEQGESSFHPLLTYEDYNEDAKEDPEDVAEDVHEHNWDESDGQAHLPLTLLTLSSA